MEQDEYLDYHFNVGAFAMVDHSDGRIVAICPTNNLPWYIFTKECFKIIIIDLDKYM